MTDIESQVSWNLRQSLLSPCIVTAGGRQGQWGTAKASGLKAGERPPTGGLVLSDPQTWHHREGRSAHGGRGSPGPRALAVAGSAPELRSGRAMGGRSCAIYPVSPRSVAQFPHPHTWAGVVLVACPSSPLPASCSHHSPSPACCPQEHPVPQKHHPLEPHLGLHPAQHHVVCGPAHHEPRSPPEQCGASWRGRSRSEEGPGWDCPGRGEARARPWGPRNRHGSWGVPRIAKGRPQAQGGVLLLLLP